MISLKQLAAAVTRKPPIISFTQLIQIISPLTLLPIKKDIDAENTTRNVRRSLISFEKSLHFIALPPLFLPSGINSASGKIVRQIPDSPARHVRPGLRAATTSTI